MNRRLDGRGRLPPHESQFSILHPTDTCTSITYTNCFPLKNIAHILARYTAWILGLMKLFGIWGVFVIAFADSALLGMPVDFVVATYVYRDRGRLLLYIAMASLGSALGSIPLYLIGYLGGEKVLRKRISEERFLKIHRSFEAHEFWALMFPGMLPPPLPFKVFVLGAAVFEMRFRDFLVAIFLGQVCAVSGAVGAGAVVWSGDRGIVRRSGEAALGVGVGCDRAGLCVWLVVRLRARANETVGSDSE